MYTSFFFTDPPTSEIYTLSLHDALPILVDVAAQMLGRHDVIGAAEGLAGDDRDLRHGRLRIGVEQLGAVLDRKSSRLNSSHMSISYAVFCLKKKNNKK